MHFADMCEAYCAIMHFECTIAGNRCGHDRTFGIFTFYFYPAAGNVVTTMLRQQKRDPAVCGSLSLSRIKKWSGRWESKTPSINSGAGFQPLSDRCLTLSYGLAINIIDEILVTGILKCLHDLLSAIILRLFMALNHGGNWGNQQASVKSNSVNMVTLQEPIGDATMTPDQYVESVLAKYVIPRGPNSPAERLAAAVVSPIRNWAGQQLNDLLYSGSYAKETGVRGISDVDIFISLNSNASGTLKEIYNSLFRLAQTQGWSPRAQNVSVGITINGTQGDLVPGKIQAGYRNYHSLFLRKRDSWTQTNVALHIDTVSNSGRVREIRAVKIWRFLRNLDFPSLYLELFTIQALSGRSRINLAENVLYVLQTMGSTLTSTRIEDPANTNNIVSDDLSAQEKQRIAALAAQSAREQYWENIIW